MKRNKEKENIPLIITICGERRSGKTVISAALAKAFEKQKYQKILIVDFNILDQKLYSIFKKQKYSKIIYNKIKKQKNSKKTNNKKTQQKINKFYFKNINKFSQDFIININKNIKLISGINLLFEKNENNSKVKIKNFIENFLKNSSQKYSVIIFDTGSHDKWKVNEVLFTQSSIILKIVDPNLLGIKRERNYALKQLEKHRKKEDGLHIVVNKYNLLSIDFQILKNFLGKRIVIGKVRKVNFRKQNTEDETLISKNLIKDCKKIINKIKK